MNAKQMMDVARRSVDEFWNTGNVAIIPEIYHADYQGYDPSRLQAGSLAEFTATSKAMFAAFSDVHVTIDEMLVTDDKCIGRWTVSSRHTGEWMGFPASGRPVSYSGINIFGFKDGKIAEVWSASDTLAFMQCIGAVPGMGEQALEAKS